MQTIYKKKTYKGFIELREDERDRLIRIGDSVKLVLKNEQMILTPEQLQEGRVINTQYSKFNEGQTYKIYGWHWKPEPLKRPEYKFIGNQAIQIDS